MNKIKQTGVRISQYPQGPINTTNKRKKLVLHHSFISWAPSYFGISTINKNYQIPISTLRDDLLGYIGVNNSKGEYRNYLNLWYGHWYDEDRTISYVYQWSKQFITHDDYIPNKHGIDIEYDKNNLLDRAFILTDAPWPLESTFQDVNPKGTKNHGIDPNPNTSKIVTKKYIDDRHNGFRKVQKRKIDNDEVIQFGSKLEIRPYTCFYQYSNKPAKDLDSVYTINICDTQTLQDGRSIKDAIENNRLTFYIRLKNQNEFYYMLDEDNNKIHKNNLKILVNGSDANLKWSYLNEWNEILRECRPKTNQNEEQQNVSKDYIFIRCQAEYIDNEFVVTCSNFFGRGKNSKRIVETEIPTTGDRTINIKLSLHENESFLTQIPPDNKLNPTQIYIKLDASDLDDYHEYTWNYYVITPDKTQISNNDTTQTTSSESIKNFDNVIFQNGITPIMWAMEDGYNMSPELQPNRIYCFEFVKVFDNILIGRIKYFVNLVKKS